MVRWFAVKSCGESVEVGAMVISSDIFQVVSSWQSFVFEPRTAGVSRWVNNIFLSCKQEHKCPDQGTRWHWIKNNTRGNIKRGKGAGKYDIGAWTGKDGAQLRCDYRGELIDLSITHLFREFPFLIKRHSAVWAENWQLARDGRTIKLLLFLLLLFLSGFFLLSHFLSFLLLLCSGHSTDLSAQLSGSFASGVHQFTGDSRKRCLTLQPPCLTRHLSEDWVWLRRIIK